MVIDYNDTESKEEKSGLISEAVKRIIATGMSAAFLTEESIRNILVDLKLPKEVLIKLLDGANKSKEDIIERIGDELASIVRKIDVVEEASRFVENHKFRVSAEIEVIRKESGESGEFKSNIKVNQQV